MLRSLTMLLLAGCASQDSAVCQGSADAWLYQRAEECEQRGFAWEDCPERPEFLKQHTERVRQCL